MIRLYAKLAASITVAFVICLAIIVMLVRSAAAYRTDTFVEKNMAGEVALVVDRIEQTPPQQIDQVMQELNHLFPYPIAILQNQTTIPPEISHKLQSKPYAVRFVGTVPETFARLSAGRIAKLGPPEPIPWKPWLLHQVVAVVLLMVLTTGLLTTWPLVRRLKRLERATEAMALGDLSQRVKVTSSDAIGALTHRFNSMAQHIEQLVSTQQHLLQAVAHEFRSPVARLRFHLELLHKANKQKQQQHMTSIDQELDELEAMVSDVLEYLRLGSAMDQQNVAPIDVDGFFAQLQKQTCLDQEIPVEYAAQPPGVFFRADPRAFDTVYRNLLQNALRYARAKVFIKADKSSTGLQISVVDDGPGIPAEDRDKIFEPFARLQESRSRDSGGVGLGLAIVRRLLKRHGGEIAVQENPTGGTCFVTCWPEHRR